MTAARQRSNRTLSRGLRSGLSFGGRHPTGVGRAALNLGSDRLSPQQRELAAIAESRGNFGGVRQQDIPPFSGRFLDLVLKEFMARSSNKAVQIARFLCSAADSSYLVGRRRSRAWFGKAHGRPSDADAGSKASVRRRDPAQSADLVSQPQHRSHHFRGTHRQRIKLVSLLSC